MVNNNTNANAGTGTDTDTNTEPRFQADEDLVNTRRAFVSNSFDNMTNDELYKELKHLRSIRVPKATKTKRRTQTEKKAATLHGYEQFLPPALKEKYRSLSTEQKKEFLKKLAEIHASKANKANK